MTEIGLDGAGLVPAAVAAVARGHAVPALTDAARARMERSAAWVSDAADGKLLDAEGQPMSVYGVNTGYGSLARVRIDDANIAQLSWNLVRSHAAGVGPSVP
ncbi:MAG: aromatic amino acid lyase, partial [Myxococcales bacterium]|nr:aromatic amino acid lyase [Myxococcales bacterium]